MKTNPVCLAPFMGLYFNPSGYAPCCFIPPKNFDSLNDYLNSDWLKGMKDAHLTGDKSLVSERCQQCIAQSNYGFHHAYRYEPDNKLVKIYEKEGPRLTNFYLAPNIKCRMSCGMCLVSDKRLAELQDFGVNKTNSVPVNENHRDDVTNDELAAVCEQLKHAEFVGVYGGDPTLVPETVDILESISDDATVVYSTNGLLDKLPNGVKLIDYLKTYKRVEFTFSLDGLGEIGKRSRKGISYKNFDKLLDASQGIEGISQVMCVTMSLYNIMRVTEIFDELYEKYYATGKVQRLFLNPVFDPSFTAIGALPFKLKRNLGKTIASYKVTLSGEKLELFESSIDSLYTGLNAKYNRSEWEKFIKTCMLEEQGLGSKITPITDLIPEYKEYFNNVIL